MCYGMYPMSLAFIVYVCTIFICIHTLIKALCHFSAHSNALLLQWHRNRNVEKIFPWKILGLNVRHVVRGRRVINSSVCVCVWRAFTHTLTSAVACTHAIFAPQHSSARAFHNFFFRLNRTRYLCARNRSVVAMPFYVRYVVAFVMHSARFTGDFYPYKLCRTDAMISI